MSALYVVRYLGQSGTGFGVIYIGKGKVVGTDITNGRFEGGYTEGGGRMKANIKMHVPAGTVPITGQQISQPTTIPLLADWPVAFADGTPQSIMIAGRPVSVTFEKIGDIP